MDATEAKAAADAVNSTAAANNETIVLAAIASVADEGAYSLAFPLKDNPNRNVNSGYITPQVQTTLEGLGYTVTPRYPDPNDSETWDVLVEWENPT